MKLRNNGMMEWCKNGMMELRNNGRLEYWKIGWADPAPCPTHHSIIP